MNLVVNARDAMPKGGSITISTNVVLLGERQISQHADRRAGRFVCLSVSDTGSGMSDEIMRHIFEPFFTTKEAGKGTGLGLATVHGIVAQHKGWVEVESELGKGTTFHVYLPGMAQAVEEEAEHVEAEPLPGGRETILLVEDESKVRQAVGQVLRALGYRVFEAENGQRAVALWQKHGTEVDLLFTDMVMPEGMTGLELAERLQALKPTLGVIISSGYSAEIVQAGGIKHTGICYLPKPYQPQRLAETVRLCLDRKP
jgi:CheY-like chemotaxis protein